MAEFATNAKANAGLALGVIGTVLAGSQIVNGWKNNTTISGSTAAQVAQSVVADLNAQIAELKAMRYSDNNFLTLYKDLRDEDSKINSTFAEVNKAIADLSTQVALNKQASDYENLLNNQKMTAFSEKVDLITSYNQQLNGLADASIISYVNATFLPGTLKLPVTSVSPQPLIPTTN